MFMCFGSVNNVKQCYSKMIISDLNSLQQPGVFGMCCIVTELFIYTQSTQAFVCKCVCVDACTHVVCFCKATEKTDRQTDRQMCLQSSLNAPLAPQCKQTVFPNTAF